MNWYLVSAKSHLEKVAALSLQKLEVEWYLPQMRQQKIIRRKVQSRMVLLFPGYLFAKFNLSTHYRAVKYATGVRQVVTFGDHIAKVEESIITGIKNRLHNTLDCPSPHGLSHGQIVCIQDGPLQGLEAVFEGDLNGHQRASLLLHTMALQPRINLPTDLLTIR